MKIRSFSHVGLTVSSFDRADQWYYEVFGFRLIDEQVMGAGVIERLYNLYKVRDATVRLGFLRAPKGGVVELFEFSPSEKATDVCWNRPGPTHFTLDVRNVQRWYVDLKRKGVTFFSEPQRTGTVDWVFLRDPDGNLIELIDLKMNYRIIRMLGGLVGKIMATGKFKKYYR